MSVSMGVYGSNQGKSTPKGKSKTVVCKSGQNVGEYTSMAETIYVGINIFMQSRGYMERGTNGPGRTCADGAKVS